MSIKISPKGNQAQPLDKVRLYGYGIQLLFKEWMVDFGAVSISTFSDCRENKMTSFAPSFASPVCFRFHFHPSCFGFNFMSSLAFTSLGLACLKFLSRPPCYTISQLPITPATSFSVLRNIHHNISISIIFFCGHSQLFVSLVLSYLFLIWHCSDSQYHEQDYEHLIAMQKYCHFIHILFLLPNFHYNFFIQIRSQ